MKPAAPPLPTAANFPFQPVGSQTSKWICESGTGAIVPATRQKAGKPPYGDGAPGGTGKVTGPSGGANAPAATSSAVVMVGFGRFSLASVAHIAGASW